MSMETLSIADFTSAAQRPVHSGTAKAHSTGGMATITRLGGPTTSADPPQRPRSQSHNSGEGKKIFKVYNYVDQSLLDENAKEIQRLRAENVQLKQTIQQWEQRMQLLELAYQKHGQANSLALNILLSNRKHDDVPHGCTLDACDAPLDNALRLSDRNGGF